MPVWLDALNNMFKAEETPKQDLNITSDEPDSEILGFISSKLDDDELLVFKEELNGLLKETGIRVPPDLWTQKTEDDIFYDKYNLNEYRPSSKLPFSIIERMKKSGICMFPLEMKRAQILSSLTNPRKRVIKCSDEKLQKIIAANLDEIFPKMADEFTYSAMVYGTAIGEVVGETKLESEVGLPATQGPNRYWTVFKVPNFVNPVSVKELRRTKAGELNGFVQIPNSTFYSMPVDRVGSTNSTSFNNEIVIGIDKTIVIPYQSKFGDLWGQSFFYTIYPYWFWFEVVLRAMVRYMERMSTPVVIGRAPHRKKVEVPGTSTLKDAMSWMLTIAKSISTSNAAVLPSDVDPITEKPMFDVNYLSAPTQTQNFKDVLEVILDLLFRSANVSDRAYTQSSGGVGSKNLAEVHLETTTLHNGIVFANFLWYINKYFMPKYSQFNYGVRGPKATLEYAGLSTRERQLMNTMLATAGNSEKVNDFYIAVDWKRLAELEGIPVKSEEEFQRVKNALMNIEVQRVQTAQQNQDTQNNSNENEADGENE